MYCLKRATGEDGRSELIDGVPAQTPGHEVFVFPGYDGSFQIAGAKKTISGMLRILTHCLSDLPVSRQPRICAIGYKELEFNPLIGPDKLISADAKKFVDDVLAPRLFPGEGKKPRLEQLEERMSRLTFVGHSYGTFFAQHVANALREDMQERGYSEKDIADTIHAGLLITTGGMTQLDTGVPQFSAIHARATNDSFIKRAASRITDMRYVGKGNDDPEKKQAYKDELKKIGMSGSREFSISYGPHHAVMNGDVPSHIVVTEHGERQVYDDERIRRDNPQMDFHHTPAPYWYRSEEPLLGDADNRMMSGLLRNALCNAATRERGQPNLEALLTDGMGTKGFSRQDVCDASPQDGRRIA